MEASSIITWQTPPAEEDHALEQLLIPCDGFILKGAIMPLAADLPLTYQMFPRTIRKHITSFYSTTGCIIKNVLTIT